MSLSIIIEKLKGDQWSIIGYLDSVHSYVDCLLEWKKLPPGAHRKYHGLPKYYELDIFLVQALLRENFLVYIESQEMENARNLDFELPDSPSEEWKEECVDVNTLYKLKADIESGTRYRLSIAY